MYCRYPVIVHVNHKYVINVIQREDDQVTAGMFEQISMYEFELFLIKQAQSVDTSYYSCIIHDSIIRINTDSSVHKHRPAPFKLMPYVIVYEHEFYIVSGSYSAKLLLYHSFLVGLVAALVRDYSPTRLQ